MLGPVRTSVLASLGAGIVVAACGRIDFDARSDGGGSDAISDSAGVLEPLVHRDSALFAVACATTVFTAATLAVDNGGNVYVGGCFSGTAQFGATPIVTPATEAAYVLRLDANLDYSSVRIFGAIGTQVVSNIAIANNSLHVRGEFEGNLDFGGGAIGNAGGDDGFVAHYALDNTFTHQGSWRFGSTADEGYGEGLAVRDDGTDIIGGGCNGAFSFGATTLPGTTLDPCVGVMRDGAELASWRWPSGNIGGVYSVALAGTGYAIGGHYTGFAPFPGLGVGMMPDGFVARLASDGTVQWARDIIGAGDDITRDVAVGDAGEVYATGFAGGAVTLAGAAQSFSGVYDGWIARFDTGGVLAWATMIGGAGDDDVNAIAIVGDNLIVAGTFEGTVTFGPDTLVSAGGTDIFVAAITRADGSIRWARRFGGAGTDVARSAAFVNGRFYVAGVAEAPIDFGGGSLGTTGTNLYVLELALP